MKSGLLPPLDSATLMFSLSIFAFVMAGLAFAAYRSFGNNRYGHLHMTLSMANGGLAALLFYLTDVVPFFLPFVIGDICVLQFMPHAIAAYGRILGRQPPKRLLLLSTLFGMAGVLSRELFGSPLSWAIASVSAALAWQFAMLLQMLLAQQVQWRHKQGVSSLNRVFVALLSIAALLFLSRSVTALFGDSQAVVPTGQSSQQLATLSFTTSIAVMTFLVYVGLVNQQVQHEVTERLQRDGLTGLYTRTAFKDMQDSIAQRATREGFALLMVDIDHFKVINDRYGHLVGDQVLSHVGRYITGSLRLSDLAIRYGGEEFCLLLWSCDQPAAERFAIRLVQDAARQHVRLQGDHTVSFTLSVGYAVHRAHTGTMDITTMIEKADQALYEAKHQGRNQARAAVVV